MIIYRIWNVQDVALGFMETGSNIQSPKMTQLDSVIHIVIDLALGYTLVSLSVFFTQVVGSNTVYITSCAVSPLLLIMYPSVMLKLEVLKEIQAVGIAFNIRVADLKNELEASWIAYNVNAGVDMPGLSIKFATVSVPSYRLNSAFASLQEPQKTSRAVDGDNRSSM